MPLANINLGGPFLTPAMGLLSAPGGGKVEYVYQDSSGNGVASLSDCPPGIVDHQNLTVAAALGKLRANRGDTIICLPNHVETIGANAWPLLAGVNIVCLGNDNERPTFNWTAAASQIAFNAKGVRVMNAIFNFAVTAATTVTKACAITAATIFENCLMTVSTSSTVNCTTGLEIATGGDRTRFDGCLILGAAAGAANPITIVNAVDSVTLKRTTIAAGTSATGQGCIQASAATTNWVMDDCVFNNTIANSTAAVVGFAGVTGQFSFVMAGIQAATGGATAIATPGNVNMFQCFGGTPGKNAIAITPASG